MYSSALENVSNSVNSVSKSHAASSPVAEFRYSEEGPGFGTPSVLIESTAVDDDRVSHQPDCCLTSQILTEFCLVASACLRNSRGSDDILADTLSPVEF